MTSQTSPQGSSQTHYSVIRGSNRRDPNYINCLNSDGTQSKWKEPGPVIDSTGITCHWKTDDPECRALEEKWKRTLGKTVAKLLHLTDDTSDEDWRIQDLPKDYKLFRHVKGLREDYYLFGSEWVTKFRTANEFSPHFHWLCTYEPTRANRIYCKCKYCSGSKQASVNSALGLNHDHPRRFTSPILDQKSSSHNKRKAEDDMAKEILRKRLASEFNPSNKPQRVPSKPLTSRKSLPNHLLNSVANVVASGRRSTFSGPYVNKDRDRDLSELKCTFRMAELVWCQLDLPIDGTKEGRPDLRIDYWPAICEERVLVSNSQVLNSNPSTDKSSSLGSLSLKVQQTFQWKVRLLATSDVYCKDESQLLAYLNYPPPLNIYKLPINSKGLKHIHDGHESDRPTINSFTSFSEALAPFALSLQITAHIKKSFTLMDRYDIALLRRLEARGQNIPIEDIQILYQDSNLPWYQYIWWGAEKIWSGELIRLIVTASELPSGLRPITPDHHSRCFFLKVTGLYRSPQEEGMVKGSIFELSPIAQRAKDEAEGNPEFEESDSIPGVQQINRYMPEPPNGYFFRRLTPVGKEHHLVLQHIAGRYYPPRHPIVLEPSNLDQPDSLAPFSTQGRSLILSGLGEGRWLHMHCETWALDRKECFKESEASAERELIAFCETSRLDETIKTKPVAVIESEVQNDGTLDVLENGMDFIESNEDIAMNAQSLAAIDHYLTNGHVQVENNVTLDSHHNMDIEPNTVTLIDPLIAASSVQQSNSVSPAPLEAGNNSILVESQNVHKSMEPHNTTVIHPQITNFSQEDRHAVTKEKTNVPIDPTEVENIVNLIESNAFDTNKQLNTVSLIDPIIANSKAKGANAAPPAQSQVNIDVPVSETKAENNRTLAESETLDVYPEPNALTRLDPNVPGDEEKKAARPGHTKLDQFVPLSESKDHDTNLEPDTVTSNDPHVTISSEKEVDGVSQSHSEKESSATVVASSHVDMNMEPNAAAAIAEQKEQNTVPLDQVQSDQTATVGESNSIDISMDTSPSTFVDSHTVNSNLKERLAVPLDQSVTVTGSNSVDGNAEPSTTTPTDVYIGKSEEKEENPVLPSHAEAGNAIKVAESNKIKTHMEPDTTTSIDLLVASIGEKEKNHVVAGVPGSNPDMINRSQSANSHVSNGSTEKDQNNIPTSITNVNLNQEPTLFIIDPIFSTDNTNDVQGKSDGNPL